MLSDEERRKIEEEEKLRTEIRKKEEKKKQPKKVSGCLILILIPVFFIIVAIIMSSGGGSKKGNEPEITKLSIGEEGIISNNDNPNDCSGETIVGVNREDIEASIESAIASDKEGFLQLVAAGRVFLVENCTSIRKIDSGGTLGSLAKIRFLEGEFGSMTGWIPYEFAVKK